MQAVALERQVMVRLKLEQVEAAVLAVALVELVVLVRWWFVAEQQ